MGAIKLATSTTTDEEYGGTFATQATDVAYDNTTSGLTADDVQGAIDEVKSGETIKFNLTTTSQSKTVSFKEQSCLIFIYRASTSTMALLAIDYWSTAPQVIAGAMPSGVTITKSALSNQMTITSTISSATAFIII